MENIEIVIFENSNVDNAILKNINISVGVFPPDLLMEYRIFISMIDISANLKNIDIAIDIDKAILKNIVIDID